MTSNNGIVMKIDKQFLRETNVKILKRHHRLTGKKVYIGTIPNNLARVFPKVEEYGNSGNREQDLIEKTAAIMPSIPWTQSFLDGNRRTSIIAAGTFMRDNGYELEIDIDDENLELRKMLKEIKRHFRDLDQNIMDKLILYTSERIRSL